MRYLLMLNITTHLEYPMQDVRQLFNFPTSLTCSPNREIKFR